jgi:hypothetical protein
MIKVDFDKQPTKTVSIKELADIMSSIGLSFYGLDKISTRDIEIFEDKTDMAFEPTAEGDIRLHDLNYDHVREEQLIEEFRIMSNMITPKEE